MPVFRFLAAVFLLIATVALVVDLSPAFLGAGSVQSTSLAGLWSRTAPASLTAAEAAVKKAAAPWAWDFGIAPILDRPLWVLFGVLALLAGYVGRRRRTVEIFVN